MRSPGLPNTYITQTFIPSESSTHPIEAGFLSPINSPSPSCDPMIRHQLHLFMFHPDNFFHLLALSEIWLFLFRAQQPSLSSRHFLSCHWAWWWSRSLPCLFPFSGHPSFLLLEKLHSKIQLAAHPMVLAVPLTRCNDWSCLELLSLFPGTICILIYHPTKHWL